MGPGPPIERLHLDGAPAAEDPPGPQARELLSRQRDVESSAVRYPHDLPLAVAEASGATVRDVDGNVYVDCSAGIGVVNVGHANPYVLEGVTDQQARLAHTLDFPSETRLELVERLRDVSPFPDDARVLFGGPTGSDAVEASIKLARAHTGGRGLLAFRGAYHGGTAGALSLTADTGERVGPSLPDVQHVPYPAPVPDGIDPDAAVERSLESVAVAIGDAFGGLADPAGIWVEPIQGESGVAVPPDGFLSGLRDLADDHGVPLIVDEVQTGFGRTGTWFACEYEGVVPDVMPVAKGVANGLPLSATVYTADVDEAVEPGLHTGTFRGYLPAMRACLRAIEYVEGHDLLDRAERLGTRLRDRLADVADASPLLADVRGRGLYVGLQFADGAGRSAGERRDDVRRRCFDEGVLVWGGGREEDVIRLMPPLVVTERQLDDAAGVLESALADAVATE
ncbi:MAG: aspartate aminotransferase family protein [Halobacteriaceae archaeon]